MRTTARARRGALLVLAAVAAPASAGIAMLARNGGALCDHRLPLAVPEPMAMAGMGGMAASAAQTGDGVCPILLFAAAAAAALFGLALALLTADAIVPGPAFELVRTGSGARWSVAGDPLLVAAGARLARRRPSRAPPILR